MELSKEGIARTFKGHEVQKGEGHIIRRRCREDVPFALISYSLRGPLQRNGLLRGKLNVVASVGSRFLDASLGREEVLWDVANQLLNRLALNAPV